MSTYNSSYVGEQIDSAIKKFYSCRNKIIVIAPVGSFVTATCEGETLTSIERNGIWIFYYTKFGLWTISAINGQDTGSESIYINELKDYQCTLNLNNEIDSTLENNSWETIKSVISLGEASSYWAIGDSKPLTLNGTVGTKQFSNDSAVAFIIGFDHNSALETNFNSSIHFQISTSIDTGFTDSYYGIDSSYNGFCPSISGNSGAWPNSRFRNILMYQFFHCLPLDLSNLISTITKYSYIQDYVETKDDLFLLSEYEIVGNNYKSGGTIAYKERERQAQYSYYINSTNRIKYKDVQNEEEIKWWTRSLYNTTLTYPVGIDSLGESTTDMGGLSYSYGLIPAFAIVA